jgi:hypothetical protein
MGIAERLAQERAWMAARAAAVGGTLELRRDREYRLSLEASDRCERRLDVARQQQFEDADALIRSTTPCPDCQHPRHEKLDPWGGYWRYWCPMDGCPCGGQPCTDCGTYAKPIRQLDIGRDRPPFMQRICVVCGWPDRRPISDFVGFAIG